MADISKIKLGQNQYDIKDSTARQQINALPAWSKASTKPTYTASQVGALPSTTQYQKPLIAGSNTAIANNSDGTATISAVIQQCGDIIQDPSDQTGGIVSSGFSYTGAVNVSVVQGKLIINNSSVVINKKLIL